MPNQADGLEAVKPRNPSGFAEKLTGDTRINDTTVLNKTQHATRSHFAADIAADLAAGRISTEVAIDRVIHRVLDRQIGISPPAAVRQQINTALREAIESDPLLLDKLKGMSPI